MLQSTYEILKQLAKEMKDKLTTEIPKQIVQSYESGGQWHDNPHWDGMLKDQESLNEKYREIIEFLKSPIILEKLPLTGTMVTIGTEVEVQDFGTGNKEVFVIVGSADIIYNPMCQEGNYISFKSPVAQALIKKLCGEEALIKLPSEEKRVVILEIKLLKKMEES